MLLYNLQESMNKVVAVRLFLKQKKRENKRFIDI